MDKNKVISIRDAFGKSLADEGKNNKIIAISIDLKVLVN